VESGQGFGKRPERFRFQEDWAIDLSEGEISAFREPGIRKTENRGNACIAVSRIAKAGSAWYRHFNISGPRCSRGFSRLANSRKQEHMSRVQERRSHETGSPDSRNREIMNSEIPKEDHGHG
jgi:hypothetical protein